MQFLLRLSKITVLPEVDDPPTDRARSRFRLHDEKLIKNEKKKHTHSSGRSTRVRAPGNSLSNYHSLDESEMKIKKKKNLKTKELKVEFVSSDSR